MFFQSEEAERRHGGFLKTIREYVAAPRRSATLASPWPRTSTRGACAILGWDSAKLLVRPATPLQTASPPRLKRCRPSRPARAARVHHRPQFTIQVVTPAVLIPRPETELIVDATLALHAGHPDLHDDRRRTGCGRRLAVANTVKRASSPPTSPSRRSGGAPQCRTAQRREPRDVRRGGPFGDLSGPVDIITANPGLAGRNAPGLQPEVGVMSPASRVWRR